MSLADWVKSTASQKVSGAGKIFWRIIFVKIIQHYWNFNWLSSYIQFFIGQLQASFSLFRLFWIAIDRWLRSKYFIADVGIRTADIMVSEATALPTAPQPQPRPKYCILTID